MDDDVPTPIVTPYESTAEIQTKGWNTVKGKQFLEVAKLLLFLTISSIIGTQNAQRPTKSTKVSTYHINLYDTNLDEQH